MALSLQVTKSVPLAGDVQVSSYVRVESILASKASASAVAVWRQNDGSGIAFDRTEFGFIPDLSGPNFIAQAYLHLKTLPEFAGATDC